MSELLEIRGLTVQFPSARGVLQAVGGADLTLGAGECLGIVGESGSGKTQLLHAILGLSPPQARLGGSVRYRGEQLLGLPVHALNRIRGHRIAMIFQDPMTALNPCLRIGTQIGEVARLHLGVSRREAEHRALSMLEAVHIADPRRCLRQYPHELSGGMRQRVMIAMALIGEPDVLLADEPTTALDVTVQAQILTLLRELQARSRASVLLVTHDLGVVAEIADRVAVMYAGRVLEQAPVDAIFSNPRHPYTEALQRCLPRVDQPQPSRLPSISGRPPPLSALPPGCPFAPRCLYRLPVCETQMPPLEEAEQNGSGPAAPPAHHIKACWHQGALGRLVPEQA
ncbi:MAG TPA: ABC transporter ATP-binding protein [Steroidobacteraceae bacterium]|jgi:oligopeptide/dipeptide ABC transporter ATP-binding protein|nr:ABC transporter ATP-binding protein [Steroidobacteraceae bacterium]